MFKRKRDDGETDTSLNNYHQLLRKIPKTKWSVLDVKNLLNYVQAINKDKALVGLDIKDIKGNTPLLLAIDQKDTNTIHSLLKFVGQKDDEGKFLIDLNIQNKDKYTALLLAIDQKDTNTIHSLLKFVGQKDDEGKFLIDLNMQHKYGYTALLLAIDQKDTNTIHSLLKFAGQKDDEGKLLIDLNIQDKDKYTALLLAIDQKDTNTIHSLLKFAGQKDDEGKFLIDLNRCNYKGNTPLLLAIDKGQKSTVDALLKFVGQKDDEGKFLIDLNRCNYKGNTPLLLAIDTEQEYTINSLLEFVGQKDDEGKLLIDLNIQNKDKYTALLLTIDQKDTNTIHSLLKFAGQKDDEGKLLIDLNRCNYKGNTPLLLAIDKGQKSTVDALLKFVGQKDDEGKLLIDLNIQNKDKYTALLLAIDQKDTNTIHSLLKFAGQKDDEGKFLIDLNRCNYKGNTPLLLAIDKGQKSTVDALLKFVGQKDDEGKLLIDLNIQNKDKYTALLLAIDQKDTNTIHSLLKFAGQKDDEGKFLIDLNRCNYKGNTPLLLAIDKGQKSTVDALLKFVGQKDDEGKLLIDLNIQNKDKYTALLLAIDQKNTNTIHSLLKFAGQKDDEGKFLIDLNRCNYKGNTPLLLAIDTEQEYTINSLLEFVGQKDDEGKLLIDLNIQNKDKYTALLLAIDQKNTNTIHSLLKFAGQKDDEGKFLIDLNRCNYKGNTPLLLAIDKGQKSTVDALLEFVGQKDDEGKLLVDDKGKPLLDLNRCNYKGNTPLLLAIDQKNTNTIHSLLKFVGQKDDEGKLLIDLNIQDKDKYTPLLLAIDKRHKQTVAALLKFVGQKDDEGKLLIDLNIQDKDKYTPLLLAIDKGQENTVAALLKFAGQKDDEGKLLLNLNLFNDDGNTPLLLAIKREDTNTVDELLKFAGQKDDEGKLLIDLNIQNKDKYTALLLAIDTEQEYTINSLLEFAGQKDDEGKFLIDLNIQNKDKYTALLLAIDTEQEYTINSLLEFAGQKDDEGKFLIDLNIQDKDKHTPLLLAIDKRQKSTVDALLEFAGQSTPLLDLDRCNYKGNTPLLLAIDKGQENTVAALLKFAGQKDDEGKLLLDLNIQDHEDYTALLLAIDKGQENTVAALLKFAGQKDDKGKFLLNLNLFNDDGNTPLLLAIKREDTNTVDELLKFVGQKDDKGKFLLDLNNIHDKYTPLSFAIKKKDIDIIDKLLKFAGQKDDEGKFLLDLNIQDMKGNTPLLLALICSTLKKSDTTNTKNIAVTDEIIISRLLNLAKTSHEGKQPLVDITIKNKDNYSALLWFQKYNNIISGTILNFYQRYINNKNDDVQQEVPSQIKTCSMQNIVGATTFQELSATGYFIDKTMFIEEFLLSKPKIILITCPRRWGKSVNMSMIHQFITVHVDDEGNNNISDIKQSENYKVFAQPNYLNTNNTMHILNSKNIIDQYMGKYPVIYLDFRKIKYENDEQLIYSCIKLLQDAFISHEYLLKSDRLTDRQKQYFNDYYDVKKFDKTLINEYVSMISHGLSTLAKLLKKHFQKKVFVLIDEYDTPTNELSLVPIPLHDVKEYIVEKKCIPLAKLTEDDINSNLLDAINSIKEKKIIGTSKIIASLMESILKPTDAGESYLEKALITGIFRISKAGFFSNLNNITEYNFFDNPFSKFYGFTKENIQSLKEFLVDGADNTIEQMMKWYGGYIIGAQNLCNPWDIMQFISHDCQFDVYRDNSSNLSFIQKVLKNTDIKSDFLKLVGGSFIDEESCIPSNMRLKLSFDLDSFIKLIAVISSKEEYYTNIPKDSLEMIFPFLLATGYLSKNKGKISIVNKSSTNLFCEKLLNIYHKNIVMNFNISTKIQDELSLFFKQNNDKNFAQVFHEALPAALKTNALWNESLIQGICTCLSLSLLMNEKISWCASNPVYTTVERKIPDIVLVKDKTALLIELKYSSNSYNNTSYNNAYQQALKYCDFFLVEYEIIYKKCILIYVYPDTTIVKSSDFQPPKTIQGTNCLYAGLSEDSINYNIQMMNSANLILVDINSINNIVSNLAILKVAYQNNNHAVVFLKNNNFISIIDPLSEKSEFSNILEKLSGILLEDKKIQEVNIIYSGLQQTDTGVCADISLILSKYIVDKLKNIKLVQDIITIIQSLAIEMYSGQILTDSQNIIVVKYFFPKLTCKQDVRIIFDVNKNNKDTHLLDNDKIISLQNEVTQQDNHDMLVQSLDLIGSNFKYDIMDQ
ncbi:ankyrin repeat domain-containing protein [Candidatus Tisiphia endosymbiont of Parasteatoda lunata]|uniref:ankyrin repeat domain-containing protein n=1 Tax=Candidatus Tisiphia endosymbiont of Parasteatoda lunata TaxID=3066275 RepID=UPI00313DD0D2